MPPKILNKQSNPKCQTKFGKTNAQLYTCKKYVKADKVPSTQESGKKIALVTIFVLSNNKTIEISLKRKFGKHNMLFNFLDIVSYVSLDFQSHLVERHYPRFLIQYMINCMI